jgi:hypothetical protein
VAAGVGLGRCHVKGWKRLRRVWGAWAVAAWGARPSAVGPRRLPNPCAPLALASMCPAPRPRTRQVGTHGMFRDRGAVGVTGESEWRPFHHTLEDLYGAVAAYYSAPALSFRWGAGGQPCWPGPPLFFISCVALIGRERPLKTRAAPTAFSTHPTTPPRTPHPSNPPTPPRPTRNAIYNLGQARRYNFRAFMREDFIHPNDAGHQAIADLAMHLLQEAAVGLKVWPLSPDDEAAALGKLPDPMYPGNHPSLRRVCFHGDDFQSTVVNSGGWDWVNEGTEASPKWGYVSTKPGSVLRVSRFALCLPRRRRVGGELGGLAMCEACRKKQKPRTGRGGTGPASPAPLPPLCRASDQSLLARPRCSPGPARCVSCICGPRSFHELALCIRRLRLRRQRRLEAARPRRSGAHRRCHFQLPEEL